MRSTVGRIAFLVATATASPAQPADTAFFEAKIRPIFVENCYACHTEARMGGLQLDTREHFLKGGKSGPIAVPGDPDASRLVKALRYNANPRMPPAGKLPADHPAQSGPRTRKPPRKRRRIKSARNSARSGLSSP